MPGVTRTSTRWTTPVRRRRSRRAGRARPGDPRTTSHSPRRTAASQSRRRTCCCRGRSPTPARHRRPAQRPAPPPTRRRHPDALGQHLAQHRHGRRWPCTQIPPGPCRDTPAAHRHMPVLEPAERRVVHVQRCAVLLGQVGHVAPRRRAAGRPRPSAVWGRISITAMLSATGAGALHGGRRVSSSPCPSECSSSVGTAPTGRSSIRCSRPGALPNLAALIARGHRGVVALVHPIPLLGGLAHFPDGR